MRAVGFYLWHDPLIELPAIKRVPGMDDISTTAMFNAENRGEDFYQYIISIEPYSMQHQSPQMKLQAITQVFGQFIVPFAPQMAEQGIGINFEGLLNTVSKYANVSELNDILEFSQPSGAYDRPDVGKPPAKMAVTKHISERVNRPGATRSGKDSALSQALLNNTIGQVDMTKQARPVR
jgi:hypothetical protein